MRLRNRKGKKSSWSWAVELSLFRLFSSSLQQLLLLSKSNKERRKKRLGEEESAVESVGIETSQVCTTAWPHARFSVGMFLLTYRQIDLCRRFLDGGVSVILLCFTKSVLVREEDAASFHQCCWPTETQNWGDEEKNFMSWYVRRREIRGDDTVQDNAKERTGRKFFPVLHHLHRSSHALRFLWVSLLGSYF